MKLIKEVLVEESGAAIIEMIMIVPVILSIVAGLLDLSLLIRSQLALDSAATAAVRLCMDNPECVGNEQVLREYLKQVDPLMEKARISISTGPQQVSSYTHHFYLDEDGKEAKRSDSNRTGLPIAIDLSLNQDYLTPLGRGISLAAGGDGSMNVHALQTGLVDTTRGDTW